MKELYFFLITILPLADIYKIKLFFKKIFLNEHQ